MSLAILLNKKYSRRSMNIFIICSFVSTFLCTSCAKLVNIPPPITAITTKQAFATDDQATSAMSGIYYKMANNSLIFSAGGMTTYGGLSADEFKLFNTNEAYSFQFFNNNLTSNNGDLYGYLWIPLYANLYSANAVLEGLQNSTGVHDSVKTELAGEAKFVRAFVNFYLVNLFGDIPLLTTTNWRKTNLLSRTSSSEIYQSIIADLKDAQSTLPLDYRAGNGQRIVPNKWAATALLARVYLYLKDWANAEQQASAVISNSNLYNLVSDLNSVFKINSPEAIWQLQQDNTNYTFNATEEGALIIPPYVGTGPYVYLTNQLLSSFEVGDNRITSWVDSISYAGNVYYYPYKYKVGHPQATANGNVSEYYMVLRLAEQYLIRAEARAQQGTNIDGALSDIDTIRTRARLPIIATTPNQTDLLYAIAHERQVELFAEWGHRWLDLKRTSEATNTLSAIKQFWDTHAQLYPIPLSELKTDPNLTQNTGY